MISRPNLALVLIIFLVSLLLSACGANPTVAPATQAVTPGVRTPQPSRTQTVTSTPRVEITETLLPHLEVEHSELNGVQVDFWHPWQGNLAGRAEEAVQEFNNTNEWGIKVQARSLYGAGALLDAVTDAFDDGSDRNAQDLPEVVAVTSDQLSALREAGQPPVDLGQYTKHAQFGWNEGEIAGFNPVFWEQDQLNGQQVGIPALRSGTVLMYNQTWAEELGFTEPPSTPASLQQQVCAAAVANNQDRQQEKHGTGGYLVDTSSLTALSWLAAFGAQPVPEEAGSPYQFESEEGEQALAYLRKLFDSGCAWVGRNPEPYDYFARRMALVYSGTLPDIYIQKQVMERHPNSDTWTVLPFPGQDGSPVVYSGGYSYALLPAEVEQQMAAWLFVRWMSKPSNQAKLAEVMPSIPVSQAVMTELQDYQAHFPWDGIFPLAEAVRPVPNDMGWRVARRVLEDAFRQVFYLPADQLTTILSMVDETIEELAEEGQE